VTVPPRPLEVAIVSGLSGAGRSTAAKCLEDLGWFVVDNLPPALLPTLADLGGRSSGGVTRIAAVVDVRGRAFFADLQTSLEKLRQRGVTPRVLFLEASDDVLVRRFESVRRPHPLQEAGGGRLVDGIARERKLLQDLRGEADLVLDSSTLNVHELRAAIDAAFAEPGETGLQISVLSFGYKYGLPVDSDLVADCRFLPNPHWVDELRPHTGRDADVSAYVLNSTGAQSFLDGYDAVLATVLAGYEREGKRFVSVALGCTGGKHRSVAMAEALGARLQSHGREVRVVHRDLGRE
jgi:UPF0042 nucleotide-binding protein